MRHTLFWFSVVWVILFSSCASRKKVESIVSHQITQSKHIENSDKSKTVYELVTVTHFLRDSTGVDRATKTEVHRRVIQENEKKILRDSIYIHVKDTVYREEKNSVGLSVSTGSPSHRHLFMATAIIIAVGLIIIYIIKK